MGKYVYPAIFIQEKKGYSVMFPDITECFSQGESLKDAILMAEDALALIMYGYEDKNLPIPIASSVADIKAGKDEIINYIACDTSFYHKKYNKKAVKKTLTIPKWLNDEATKRGINFSQTLQDALMEIVDGD